VVTGIIGVACLVSVAVRRPLHLVVLRYLGRRNPRFARIAADPGIRRTSLIATAIIGMTFLLHAAAITALALTVPTGTFLALSHPVGLSAFGVGILTLLVYQRWRQARPDRDQEPP
jgi:hypothetical protein